MPLLGNDLGGQSVLCRKIIYITPLRSVCYFTICKNRRKSSLEKTPFSDVAARPVAGWPERGLLKTAFPPCFSTQINKCSLASSEKHPRYQAFRRGVGFGRIRPEEAERSTKVDNESSAHAPVRGCECVCEHSFMHQMICAHKTTHAHTHTPTNRGRDLLSNNAIQSPRGAGPNCCICWKIWMHA